MKKWLLIATAAVALSGPVSAASNVALGKAVTLSGTFGTDGDFWGNPALAPNASLVDGVFRAEGNPAGQWNIDSLWWNGSTHAENAIDVNLGGQYKIDRLVLQADDNDVYRIQYFDALGWHNAQEMAAVGGWGLRTRDVSIGEITTDRLRITAVSGDSYYAVSEFQAFGVAAVPEPSEYTMMLAGLAVVGYGLRRRKA